MCIIPQKKYIKKRQGWELKVDDPSHQEGLQDLIVKWERR